MTFFVFKRHRGLKKRIEQMMRVSKTVMTVNEKVKVTILSKTTLPVRILGNSVEQKRPVYRERQ